MSQNIALKLTLYGTEVAVQNIEELETALRVSREELRKLTFGSEEFNKLAQQIKNADSRLKDFNKQAEGKDLEARIGDLGKLGGAIGAGFAGATAALQIFGAESEDASKAIQTAQNALTIALAARGAAEGAVVVKQYASLAATKLQTIATNNLNAATVKFFTTLLANPLTLIITLLGAAAAAAFFFGEEEELAAIKTTKLTDAINESVASVVLETEKIRILTSIVQDSNATNEQRLGAYAELQKVVPTLTNLTLEQAEAEGVLNEFVEDQIRLIELRARAKALEQFAVEEEVERIKRINTLRDASTERILQERNAIIARLEAEGASTESIQRALNAFDEEVRTIKEGFDVKEEYINITREIAGIQQRQTEIINGQKEATTQLDKSEQDRINTLRQLLQLRLEQISLEQQLERSIQAQLFQSVEFKESDAAVVKALKERLSSQEALIKSLEQYIPLGEKFNAIINPEIPDKAAGGFERLKQEVGAILTLISETGPVTEKIFNQVFNDPETGLQKTVADFKEEFKDLFDAETIQNIDSFVGNAKVLAEIFNKQEASAKKLNVDLDEIYFTYGELLDVINDTNATVQIREESLRKLSVIEQNLNRVQILTLRNTNAEYQKLLKQRATASGEELKDINEQLKRFDDEFTKTASEGTKKILTLVTETNKFTEGIDRTADSVKNLNKELTKGTTAATNAFILANKELFAMDVPIEITGFNQEDLEKIDEEIDSGRFDRFKQFETDIEDLTTTLLAKGFDIRKMSYEQRLVLLREYIAKEVQANEEADKNLTDSFQKKTDKILLGIQSVQSVLTSLSQATSDFYQFQLDELAMYNEKIQSKIVGDSEEANKKRLEADLIYQTKRKDLEKQAAKTALRISLAQSIANGAEAITKAFAQGGPVLGQIASVIVAGINATQIGIISAQLTSLNSMQRGGRIKTGQQGFVVQGPPHEMGGVTYGQMGVQLEGGEAVLNRVSSLRFNDLLSSINQAGGGRPLVMNNFDDSRLLEALAKQKSEPIRAYVVESDITQSQQVQKRLEQLSTL